MTMPIRVLVVDDSAFMRKALVRRIELSPRFKVIDTAENGEEAVRKAKLLKPDVITMDVEMPVMNGIEALRVLVAQTTIPVIMVSAVTEVGAKTTLEALEIGAVDFIPKAKGAELIHEKLLAAASAKVRVRHFAPVATNTALPQRPVAFRNCPQIVIIGSSTGGPQALQQVISQLPASLPVPVVVAQHMPSQFTLALANRLNDTCPPRVLEAKDGDKLMQSTVYIAPGGMHLRVSRAGLSVSPDKGESLYKPSIDVLAESALEAFGGRVLGVMLTGMGNDGAAQFVKLKRAGGYNLSQDEASCVVYGMPKSLVDAGGADEVLPLVRIGPRIAHLVGVSANAIRV